MQIGVLPKFMPLKPQNEDSILRKISDRSSPSRARRPPQSVSLGIGDDAALFRPKRGHETILTCDWFLEGTHFLRDKHPPDSIGWKCLARAVSDIAAMGGAPRCFLLSLALPETHIGRWLDLFLGGLRRASRKFQCALAGGDTSRRNEILINITVVGEVRAGRAVLRSGAREGNLLYVSGRLGEAELGLRVLKQVKRLSGLKNPALRKHLYPEPRLALGRWLAERRLATSMIDLSDGLSTDLIRLCRASGVGALISADDLPCVKQADARRGQARFPSAIELAFNGGDDYELLFTARRGVLPSAPWKFRGVPIHPIGYVTSGPNVVLAESGGPSLNLRVLSPGGWDPFRKKP
jgi:thiamine-monophosphate kinase